MTELMLKLAAFLAMVIDHAAACRLDKVFFPAFSKVYMISRAIGRMAFPIYAFCLVEGFRHSHDLRRYGGRLLLLGVISQLPYAFTLNRWYLEPAFGEVFPINPSRAFRSLNILFTLFIFLVSIYDWLQITLLFHQFAEPVWIICHIRLAQCIHKFFIMMK